MSSKLLSAMMAPTLYEHETSEFTLLETHISWVLLTGDYVYKIKKPMDFGFLNFSSLESRKKYCQMEVSLNQRLAPKLYEKVVPISGSATSPKINDDSNIFEYAIRMKQFPLEAVFDAMHKDEKLPKKYLLDAATQLAKFHFSAEVSPDNSYFGTPDHIWYPVNQNFEQIRPFLTEGGDIEQLDKLEKWAKHEFKRVLPVIKDRKKQGFIKACHGDVHLGNIALFENNVTLFDGIEFNEEFRWTDTMADLGFLVMDLESKKLPDYAAAVIDTYMEISGDCCGLALLRFYKSYRAMVKAKVALFSLVGKDADDRHKQEVFNEYRLYSDLAEQYCEKPSPFLITMHGLSGSGKSTASDHIVGSFQAIRLRSDVERKRLFGLRPQESSQHLEADIYTSQATKDTYRKLLWLARNILKNGYSVVVDSAALLAEERALFKELADKLSFPFLILSCQAPDKELIQRIENRQKNSTNVSEATPDIIKQQLDWLEPITNDESEYTITLDTTDKEWLNLLKTMVIKNLHQSNA